jgi:phosphatidate cytidylyltransferase
MSNLQQRLIFGIISITLAILIIWNAPYPYFRLIFSTLIAAVVAAASYEFLQIAETKKYEPLIKTGAAASFFYTIACYLSVDYSWAGVLPFTLLFITLIGSFFYYFNKGRDPIANLSITLFSLIYVAIPLSAWIGIAFFFPQDDAQQGRWWIFYLLAVTKFTDMGAYFVGSLMGKNKLSPYISPGKSWEGAIGGLVIGTLASFLFYFFSKQIPFQITLFQSIWLGLLLSMMGQLGDLAESLLKRDAGVKNSSIIPGLGGILDMVDSLVFTSPIVYIFLMVNSN